MKPNFIFCFYLLGRVEPDEPLPDEPDELLLPDELELPLDDLETLDDPLLDVFPLDELLDEGLVTLDDPLFDVFPLDVFPLEDGLETFDEPLFDEFPLDDELPEPDLDDGLLNSLLDLDDGVFTG